MLGTITKLQIKSSRPNKSYGFVEGDNGETYYFRLKEVIGEIKPGDKVSFTGVRNDKGGSATQIKAVAI
jgi:cold shock CspA family protein